MIEVKENKDKTKLRFCKDCKFYDKSTERDFHRKVGKTDEKGERTEIVELRAICRNKKAKSFGHLVMAEYSKRQCEYWEKGKYVPSEKPEEKPKKEAKTPKRWNNPAKKNTMTSEGKRLVEVK